MSRARCRSRHPVAAGPWPPGLVTLGASLLRRDPRGPGGVLLHAGQEGAAPVVHAVHEVMGGRAAAEVLAGAGPVPLGQPGERNVVVRLAEVPLRTPRGLQ